MRRHWTRAAWLAVIVGSGVGGTSLFRHKTAPTPPPEVSSVVRIVDARLEAHWSTLGVAPAERADDLTVLRRLSLALHGTVPSLEEIRAFEADPRPNRLAHWTGRLLEDDRFAAYFAERLARAYVGTEQSPFLVFRRDRFVGWLRRALRAQRPFDEVVRAMIADRGLWTGRPATNFITRAVVDGQVNADQLAGQTVRRFLGQRIDCAQCHDHPYDDWTQAQFAGLAAYYRRTEIGPGGIGDTATSTLSPAVPFGADWIAGRAPASGARAQLAAWVTHPSNRRFTRATVNRVWALMFGRPYSSPIDDLPDPDDDDQSVLDILGDDLQQNGYDLRRLVFIIASTRVFRLTSGPATSSPRPIPKHAWACYPLTRLRPEQVVGALLQAASVRTIDRDSHWLVRAVRFIRERDFVQEYGDLGADELAEQPGTIPQALLRLNGKLFQELTHAQPFGAVGRVSAFARNDEACLETLYLSFFTRRPTADERDYFLPILAGTTGDERGRRVEDIAWTLANAAEFSWNH